MKAYLKLKILREAKRNPEFEKKIIKKIENRDYWTYSTKKTNATITTRTTT